MKQRHALWSGIASGRGVNANTREKRLALQRWNIVTLAERFKWTPHYIASLPQSFIDDVNAICNIRDHYSKSSP